MPDTLFETASANMEKQPQDLPRNAVIRSHYESLTALNYLPTLPKIQHLAALTATINQEGSLVVAVTSPEAEAISGAGAFVSDKNSTNISFRFPRFHLGVVAQFDLAVAMFQLAQQPEMKKILRPLNDQNSGIIYFAREGHMTEWQQAVYLTTGANLPTTLALVHHKPAQNRFTRVAEIDAQINLEGFSPKNLETLFLCDPVASGMQQVRMIEELKRLDRLPRQVVVIAPMATLYGMRVIAQACIQLQVEFYGGVLGSLLDTTKPLHYYSPYPKAETQVVDSKLHQQVTSLLGETIHTFCIRGNWTGSFWAGDHQPLIDSQKELTDLGLTNETLLTLCSKLTVQLAKEMDIYQKLLPYSTLLTTGSN